MFKCKICGLSVKTVKKYVEHIQLHSNLPKVRLPCCFQSCLKTTSTYAALRQHIGREHNRRQMLNIKITAGDEKLRCSFPSCCTVFQNHGNMIKHLKLHIREGKLVECPMRGCGKKYRVVPSFTSHLNRDHGRWQSCKFKDFIYCSSPANRTTDERVACEDEHFVVENDENDIEDFQGEPCDSKQYLREEFTKNLALFFVKLTTHFLIPESTVSLIAEELQNVAFINQKYVKESLKGILRDECVKEESITNIMQVMNDSDLVISCLGEAGILHGPHRRMSYVKANFKFVDPQPVYSGVDSKNKSHYCYYVPVKDSLLSLLEDSSVLQQCLAPSDPNKNSLSDFSDGTLHASVSGNDPTENLSLSLILYQDAFEVANPLGSAKRKHKILGFYYVLGNLKPHNRSAVHHIQLALLGREADINSIGQRAFGRLVSDLKALEIEGLQVQNYHFTVVITAIVGDSLGSHWLGGFVTNFSGSQHICRFCTMTGQALRESTHSIASASAVARSVESYNQAVKHPREFEKQAVDGVKFDSIFNSLRTFHVCNPGLPPCIAHDIFEGIIVYDLPLMLRYFVRQKKQLCISSLNKRIQCFKYLGSDLLAKPPALNASLDRLCGSASQNWCLLRFLPLLISCQATAHDIFDDEVYKLLLLLREVVEYVVAPNISYGQIAHMKILVDDYLERRQSLFADVPLRPKHHYLSHYPGLTLKFGPLVRFWTLRFESKHQFFKRCVRSSRNFINVSRMLAFRHQLLQAYLSASNRFLVSGSVTDAVFIQESSLPEEICIVVRQCGVETGHLMSQLTYKGTTYHVGHLLPLVVQHSNKYILFGKISAMFLTASTLKAAVFMLPAHYDFDLGCFVVLDSTGVDCVDFSSFADYYPLSQYTVNEKIVVVLKHQLVDSD